MIYLNKILQMVNVDLFRNHYLENQLTKSLGQTLK